MYGGAILSVVICPNGSYALDLQIRTWPFISNYSEVRFTDCSTYSPVEMYGWQRLTGFTSPTNYLHFAASGTITGEWTPEKLLAIALDSVTTRYKDRIGGLAPTCTVASPQDVMSDGSWTVGGDVDYGIQDCNDPPDSYPCYGAEQKCYVATGYDEYDYYWNIGPGQARFV